MFKANYGILLVLIILLPQFLSGLKGSGGVVFDYALGLEHADSLYASGTYKAALNHYAKILDAPPVRRDASIKFRIAYSAYKTSDYPLSANLFKELSENDKFLTEYTKYFYIKSTWPLDSTRAFKLSKKYIVKYEKHAFADSLVLPVANFAFNKGLYKTARKYYLMAKSLGIDRTRDAEFLIEAARCNSLAGNRKGALNSYRQIIKKYARHSATRDLVNRLRTEEPAFVRDYRFDIISVYMTQRRFTTARRMLEEYLSEESSVQNKEKARFLITKIYYQQGKYKTALYGFKNLLNSHTNASLEPHLIINIARAYRKLGNKKKAIETYLSYAERFPRRRLASEAVWKSAWLAEDLNQPQKALEYYHLVYSRWPGSPFAKEAYFREGFTHYRSGNYDDADRVFSDIRLKNWPDKDVNRGQYWSALCREQLQDTSTARRLRLELAENLWDDYYTMRSYLWKKDHADSIQIVTTASAYPGGNPLLYYGDGMSRVLNKIEAVFQLRLLLGEKYGKIALSDVKFSLKTKQEWIALAEIYKKFANYGRAYEVYDYINRRFFADISFVEKTFMLKERFPYYYDTQVNKYSKRYNVEKELVLAVIKQESAFKTKARSWANAHGLMQLIPATAGEMATLTRIKLKSVGQLYEADFNIRLGTRYLKRLNYQFNGRKECILAAYNAGPNRVKRWQKKSGADQQDVFIENIEFSETRDYVRKVLKNYWAYKVLNGDTEKSQEILLGMLD